MSTMATDFLIDRDDPRKYMLADTPLPEPAQLDAAGAALLRVDAFAFTANNISYAITGRQLGYWAFYPARDNWGRLPVWGFADVVRAGSSGLNDGERLYGFLPMSTHVAMQPTSVSPGGFVDGTEHRRALPPVYNRYARCTADPLYRPEHEAWISLFRPLFMTAFLIADFLERQQTFGASRVVLTSASSKTASGLAFLLSRLRNGPQVIGLTSSANAEFVRSLGCYDQAVTYEAIDQLPGNDAVVVDMAGNTRTLEAVHRRYGDGLRYSCLVGASHWDQRGPMKELPGAKPTFFFAPDHAERRIQEWGADGLNKRFAGAWMAFMQVVPGWLTVCQHRGAEAAKALYQRTLDGDTAPHQGNVLSLHKV